MKNSHIFIFEEHRNDKWKPLFLIMDDLNTMLNDIAAYPSLNNVDINDCRFRRCQTKEEVFHYIELGATPKRFTASRVPPYLVKQP